MTESKEYDKVIMAEAERQRKHDLEMARVAASQEADRLRAERINREGRRTWFGLVLLGVGALVIICFMIWAVYSDGVGKRTQIEKQQIRDHQIAETCIKEGNLWVDGNCLLTKREVP